ncbi:hypothetical protein IHE44_0000649 [Lamprotornis superbus]|uniref:SYC2L protein n=1 Tax=Lamprotornis superbus TaxID=245042 RepID=A0A835P0Z5_9PASS|nr:hypothetical protein IHE44_0000649 [Lamprotornis superbus]
MAQEVKSEERNRDVSGNMADRAENYLESLLIDAFKGKGFQKIHELLQEKEVEPPQKYSESLFNQLDKALRKASTINNLNYPNTQLGENKNEFKNVSLLLKCIQLYLKSDLQEGKSLFIEQGLFLTNSFNFYLVSWFERARAFVTIIDPHEDKFLMLLLEDFFDSALVICKCSNEGKKELVNLFLPELGRLVTEANLGCALHLEALRTLNSILDSLPREERKKFPLSEEMCSLTKDLAKTILEVGDYDLQVALSEALCRLMIKKWRDDLVHHWFEDKYLAEAFKEIKDREFETDCRKFLNLLNERLGDKRRVFSFPCISAFADMNEVKKPSDEKLEEFWIDFNAGSQSVTFYVDCDEVTAKPRRPWGALWDSVRLSKENVNSYSVKEKDRQKVVKILMMIPAALNKTEATKVKLVFSAEFEILSVLRKVLGDEKLVIIESEDETIHTGKEAMQNEKVLPVSSASSGSDYESKKEGESRQRPQKEMLRKQSTLSSKGDDLPTKFHGTPGKLSREEESTKRKDSDILSSTIIKKPKFSSLEKNHLPSEINHAPKKISDSVEEEVEIKKGQEMDASTDDVFFSKMLHEDLSDSGVISAFESFIGQLKKLFWSRYKRIEVNTQDALRSSEKNLSALLNQIHRCRLDKFETFQKIVVEELANLEKETQILAAMEKDALDFWNAQLIKLNTFCNQQKQRIESVDSALGETAKSFADSAQNTTYEHPMKKEEENGWHELKFVHPHKDAFGAFLLELFRRKYLFNPALSKGLLICISKQFAAQREGLKKEEDEMGVSLSSIFKLFSFLDTSELEQQRFSVHGSQCSGPSKGYSCLMSRLHKAREKDVHCGWKWAEELCVLTLAWRQPTLLSPFEFQVEKNWTAGFGTVSSTYGPSVLAGCVFCPPPALGLCKRKLSGLNEKRNAILDSARGYQPSPLKQKLLPAFQAFESGCTCVKQVSMVHNCLQTMGWCTWALPSVISFLPQDQRVPCWCPWGRSMLWGIAEKKKGGALMALSIKCFIRRFCVSIRDQKGFLFHMRKILAFFVLMVIFDKTKSSQKTAYLNVEVDEEDDQCGHVGGLEHEAAKWESTWLHSCAECVHNSEQKLDLWREDNAGMLFYLPDPVRGTVVVSVTGQKCEETLKIPGNSFRSLTIKSKTQKILLKIQAIFFPSPEVVLAMSLSTIPVSFQHSFVTLLLVCRILRDTYYGEVAALLSVVCLHCRERGWEKGIEVLCCKQNCKMLREKLDLKVLCCSRRDNIKEKQELKTEMESNRVTTVLQNRTAPETATKRIEGKTKVEGKSGPNAYSNSCLIFVNEESKCSELKVGSFVRSFRGRNQLLACNMTYLHKHATSELSCYTQEAGKKVLAAFPYTEFDNILEIVGSVELIWVYEHLLVQKSTQQQQTLTWVSLVAAMWDEGSWAEPLSLDLVLGDRRGMCRLPQAGLQVLTSILLLHRRSCDRSQGSRLKENTEPCKTSLADSPELRVKSAVEQLAVEISHHVPWVSKSAECGAVSWHCQPCPAAVWEEGWNRQAAEQEVAKYSSYQDIKVAKTKFASFMPMRPAKIFFVLPFIYLWQPKPDWKGLQREKPHMAVEGHCLNPLLLQNHQMHSNLSSGSKGTLNYMSMFCSDNPAAWRSTYLYEHVEGEQCDAQVIHDEVRPERERRSVLHELVAQPYAEKMFLLLENVLNYLDYFFTKAKVVLKIVKEKLFTVHEKTILQFFCLC